MNLSLNNRKGCDAVLSLEVRADRLFTFDSIIDLFGLSLHLACLQSLVGEDLTQTSIGKHP